MAEGNHQVTIVFGDDREDSTTTVRAESRQLLAETVRTNAGEFLTRSFTVNVRNSRIAGSDRRVKLKSRETDALRWDDKLSLEFTGKRPAIRSIEIQPAENVTTVFLAGDSTVTDQQEEPWAGWGQMLPRFFKQPGVAVANHAESGETLKAFLAERRLEKILSQIKHGDYLFIQFAHNDQKPGRNHLPAMTGYKEHLKQYIDEARRRGATPVLVTSMHRRRFGADGKIENTLSDYPEAVRQVGQEEKVTVIDLNAMSKQLYEALGPEKSKKAFVHYPAGTFPNQDKALKDDTHFNNYGAYELARCVIEGIRTSDLPLAKLLAEDVKPFDPGKPDPVEQFDLPPSPATATTKPAGS